MPEIREIDEFKEELIQLGNEPEIRSSRGEALPDIAVPEAGDSDDLSALFEEAEQESGDSPDDFSLDNGLDEGSDDGLDELPADMLDELDVDEIEAIESGEFETGEESEETAAAGEAMDEFAVPEGLTDGFAEDIEIEEGVETLENFGGDQDTLLPETEDDIFDGFDEIQEDAAGDTADKISERRRLRMNSPYLKV